MITPKIEELLWNGNAKYESFTLGGSGTLTINQQPGSFIIITDFLFFPFIDRNPQDTNQADLFEYTRAVQHTIRFKSNNLYYYNFRNNITQINHSPQGTGDRQTYFTPVDTALKTDCYQVHRSTIQIDIFKLLNPVDWNSFSIDPVPGKSNEFAPGNGYLGLSQVSKIEMQGNVNYVPLTAERSQYVNPLGYREQFYSDIDITSELKFPLITPQCHDGVYQYPLVNINIVRVNENINEKLF